MLKGESLTLWEYMATHALSFFRGILGGSDDGIDQQTKAEHRSLVFEVVSDRLTQEEKERLNGPFLANRIA